MSPAAAVEIVDVFPEAVKVPAETVKPGDLAFDPMGGTHEVGRVVLFKRRARIVRKDKWPITLGRQDPITVIRGAP